MASTTTVEPGRATAATAPTRRRRGFPWAAVRSYVGIALIVIFCLAPFYWMIVTSFRDVGFSRSDPVNPPASRRRCSSRPPSDAGRRRSGRR